MKKLVCESLDEVFFAGGVRMGEPKEENRRRL